MLSKNSFGKKKFIAVALTILSPLVLMGIYNNFTAVSGPTPLQEIVSEARKIDDILSKGHLDAITQNLVKLHRIKVSNLIVILTNAKNCSDLAQQDRQFLSADYKFYDGKSPNPMIGKCTHARDVIPVVNSILLED